MIIRKWSDAENQFMKTHYATLGPEICAKHLKRTKAATAQHAWMYGFSRMNPSLTEKTYVRILSEECSRFGMPLDVVRSSLRSKRYSPPKFRAWARLHDMGYSYPQIGKQAKRDHSAILSGAKKAHLHPDPPLKLIQPAGGIDKHFDTFVGDQLRAQEGV